MLHAYKSGITLAGFRASAAIVTRTYLKIA
jgi:hypothetical protein